MGLLRGKKKGFKPGPKVQPGTLNISHETSPEGTVHLRDLIGKPFIKLELGVPQSLGEKSVALMLTNGPQPMSIEITGTVLHPQDNGYQRLFVAGAEELAHRWVELAPNETREITLTGCCMDQSKAPPNGEMEYEISTERPSDPILAAGRNWVAARQALARLEGTKGDVELAKSIIPPKGRRQADLSHVQAVCWGHAQP